MRKFKAGQAVRVEQNAVIVEQPDRDNPYWYTIEFPSGERLPVNIGRINSVAEECKATIDTDGSVLILSNRLSLSGAKDLIEWLECHVNGFDDDAYADARRESYGDELKERTDFENAEL